MTKHICVLLLPIVYILVFPCSCTNDNEEDFALADCTDTLDVGYFDVQPIFEQNCYGCHGDEVSYEGIKTNSYQNLTDAVNTGMLLPAINHENNFTPMPYNQAKLSPCDIKKIEIWIDNGMNP